MAATVQAAKSAGKGWYSRGYVPHFDVPGLLQHVTFHLGDSLPRPALARMRDELRHVPRSSREAERRRRLGDLLDAGLGSCLLQRNECAKVVEGSLLFGDGDRYRLLAWVVMPNHVHVLIEQLPGWPLGRIVQSWKRHTAAAIRRLHAAARGAGPVRGSLWQRDYWDRYIRDERHLIAALRYIDRNPVVAGLVETPEAWRWGSARFSRSGSPAGSGGSVA